MKRINLLLALSMAAAPLIAAPVLTPVDISWSLLTAPGSTGWSLRNTSAAWSPLDAYRGITGFKAFGGAQVQRASDATGSDRFRVLFKVAFRAEDFPPEVPLLPIQFDVNADLDDFLPPDFGPPIFLTPLGNLGVTVSAPWPTYNELRDSSKQPPITTTSWGQTVGWIWNDQLQQWQSNATTQLPVDSTPGANFFQEYGVQLEALAEPGQTWNIRIPDHSFDVNAPAAAAEAVPEPGTWLAIATGLIVLGLRRQDRKFTTCTYNPKNRRTSASIPGAQATPFPS